MDAELSSAVDSYFETRHDEVIRNSVNPDQDWLKELGKVIYSAGEDDFSKEISGAKDQLASALGAYVN